MGHQLASLLNIFVFCLQGSYVAKGAWNRSDCEGIDVAAVAETRGNSPGLTLDVTIV